MNLASHNLEKKKYNLPRLGISRSTRGIFFAGILAFSSLLFGQSEETDSKNAGRPKGGSSAQNILDIKDYQPFAKTDSRFHVSRPSFSRRFVVDGSGEYLNVTFYVQNYITEPIELYLFVSAYYESDLVDDKYRKWVSHTHWRKRDVYKEHFIVNKVSIVPKDILPSLIWDSNDPDYTHYENLSNIRSNFVSTTEPLADVYPPIWKYLEYINHNPKTGVHFQLHGRLSPASDKNIQTGNAPALLYERGGKAVMSKKSKPKYTMEHSARLSIAHSYHFADFQRSQKFFNRVVIELFDAQVAEAQSAAGEASEAAFKKIYSIKVPYQSK